MRTRLPLSLLLSLSLLLLLSAAASAQEPPCGTSEANDARVRALYERASARSRIVANAASVPVERDGTFYLPADEELVAGYRPFDLDGQSLVLEPRLESRFAVKREALRYIEPSSTFLHDFQTRSGTPWHSFAYDIKGSALQLLGRSVTRLHLTAFNGIHFDPPAEISATQFDPLESAVHRQPVLSPLMITSRKPSRLHYPQLFVEESEAAVVITWRSTGGDPFGYDVQAELRRDGSVVYSYRSMREMKWGSPVLSAGFDPSTVARRALGSGMDAQADVATGTPATQSEMTDIRRIDVERIDEGDLFAVRVQLQGLVDTSRLVGDQSLRIIVQIDLSTAWLVIDHTGWQITPMNGPSPIANGAAARILDNVVELYGIQASSSAATLPVRVWTQVLPSTRTVDFASTQVFFDPPAKRIESDLSALANGSELELPITEGFVLGEFNPRAVFNRLQVPFALSDHDIDAVAMYQSFYTDIIFYAGAYATGGNAGVDGIAPPSQSRGRHIPRSPTLLHMNQLTYGWNASEKNSSQVMLHELGHRWLYFFRIAENGQLVRSLNPRSAHPAAFVHTPAAFRVFDDDESSVMGGASWALQGNSTWRARAVNGGYSWTDLYLIGVAAPEEVRPWFYLACTDPPQRLEYWPADGAIARGERRDVTIDQVISAEGARSPSAAISQRQFRVLFVLVTDVGGPTDAEVAKMNEWRTLLARTFSLATGGRGRVVTEWVRVPKRRAAR